MANTPADQERLHTLIVAMRGELARLDIRRVDFASAKLLVALHAKLTELLPTLASAQRTNKANAEK